MEKCMNISRELEKNGIAMIANFGNKAKRMEVVSIILTILVLVAITIKMTT